MTPFADGTRTETLIKKRPFFPTDETGWLAVFGIAIIGFMGVCLLLIPPLDRPSMEALCEKTPSALRSDDVQRCILFQLQRAK